jgi:mono/diheme cytochrome c family protein
MSKIRGQILGVLTTLVLTSFIGLHAQSAGSNAPFRDNAAWAVSDGVWSTARAAASPEEYLMTRGALADSVTTFEYRAPAGSSGKIYLMGRYAVELPGVGAGEGEWTPVLIRFRAPRFDAGFTKKDPAFVIEARVGKDTKRGEIHPGVDAGARWDGEDFRGPGVVAVVKAPFALRSVNHAAGDFEPLVVPKTSGAETNEKDLLDSVALGKEAFDQLGCVQCHLVAPSETAMSTGPNLYGLIQSEPRAREVAEGEGHRFSVKASRSYLLRSIRAPAEQLAVAESGPTKGEAYLPVMPAFPRDILDDAKIEAIGDYLATLNAPQNRGPVVKLVGKTPAAPYDPMTDGLQWLVGADVRLQRGPLPGVSARSIHVGNPNGVNYSFDPRLLAIAKIWQGGFLDMEGELTGRGGRGMKLGHESREIGFGDREYLLAPLQPDGKPIDFSFKEAKFGDGARMKAALNGTEDQLAQIAAIDAKFLGYSRDSRSPTASPAFKYRVGKNVIETSATFADSGSVTIAVRGTLAAPQVFVLNPKLLAKASVTAGKLDGDRWTLPAGKLNATLESTIALGTGAWRPAASKYAYKRAPLERTPAVAKLPAGYSIENYYPPKDNYGRPQLFEALGLSLAKDGTVVVATRNAGIWRLVGNEWRLFAEGLFDSLGVVVEDGKGLVVVAGQKAELTRISDTNGDGIADRYETLFDAHSYHGNYHTYLHGPVRAKDGAYYFALNLAHGGDIYMGGGQVMGTYGGFNGWAVRVEPDGKYQMFANGLRSPASVGTSPDGRVWYADNQGDFVGTSKLYELKKDKFYGHPAGLVDLPGMTPASPEIQWEKVAGRKEKPVVLFPHNRVANSPGNPAWITQGGFGPFAGEILIGDQTQSNLLRVSLQKVGDVEQGSVMPFFEGLESGVMRPLFLRDGSLLLGQTGRGWQAKGGKVASLQHVRWDGKTVAPAIASMEATPKGFTLKLTQPLGAGVSVDLLKSALTLASWTYRDAPDYGSPELGARDEKFESLAIGADRRSVAITLASRELPQVHPRQLARVYHAKLAAQTLFDADAPAQLDAYYSLLRFPD